MLNQAPEYRLQPPTGSQLEVTNIQGMQISIENMEIEQVTGVIERITSKTTTGIRVWKSELESEDKTATLLVKYK